MGENELVNMVDCEVIEGGKIVITRGITISGFSDSVGIIPGRGLFLYSSDYEGAIGEGEGT